jgi:hypothetical protein
MHMLKLFATLRHLTLPAFFSLLLLAAGCNQDPIFDYISGETAPTTAKIKGSPSKIVDVGGNLYLANGRLWEYASATDANSSWERISGPGGFVVDVASTSGVLYALTLDNTSSKVWKRKDGAWDELTLPDGYGFAQNIFGAGDALFATVAKGIGDTGYKLCYSKTDSLMCTILEGADGASLTGAGKIEDTYYLAVWGKGIYKISDSGATITLANPSGPTDVAGLLQANNNLIIGISRGGILLSINASEIKVGDTSLGGTYSGAIALMDSPNQQEDKLLLLGLKRQSSSYEQGYMELPFKSDGTYGGAQTPGQAQPSSIDDQDGDNPKQYTSSLRRYPVTALWVLPPSESATRPVIFASTSNRGLYSYRARSGRWQWNHEE